MLLLFGMHFTSISMFRFFASFFQTVVASTTAGSISILFLLSFGGFIIPHSKFLVLYLLLFFYLNAFNRLTNQTKEWNLLHVAAMPSWLKWGFWVSPLSYGEIGLAVNEFLSPRWNKVN